MSKNNTLNRLTASLSESVVLGALAYNLDWMDVDGVNLQREDFFNFNHQVIFSIMRTHYLNNNLEITPEMMAIEAEKHPAKNKHTITIDLLKNIKEVVGENSFETFQHETKRLNKLKILRKMHESGFDVKQIIGEDGIDAKSVTEIIDEYTEEDLLNFFRIKIDTIVEDSDLKNSGLIKSSDGIDELIEANKAHPQVGAQLSGQLLSSVIRGAQFSRYVINSAPSNVGKSRLKLGDAAFITMPRIEGDKLIHRKEPYEKALYVTTEMSHTEIQQMLIANVSGVDESKIKEYNLTPAEEMKVMWAVDIIKTYGDNLVIEQIPDPSTAMLKSKIESAIRRQGVEYVFFDYIFSSPSLISEFRTVREDVALMNMSNVLKEIAVTNNVFMSTSTQVNAKLKAGESYGEDALRGSRAIADKADAAYMSFNPTEAEVDEVQFIIDRLGVPRPNIVTHVYKNRMGVEKNVKIFREFDTGTCRINDLFIVNDRNEIIELPRIYATEFVVITQDEWEGVKDELSRP